MIKHVYLISIDALRFDCVPFQKNKSYLQREHVLQYLKTPTLNRLTKKTLNFSQATTAAPYTSASHASVFTGLYPPNHHVRAFLNPVSQSLAKNVITLAEIFESEGYKTVFASDEEAMVRPLGIDRGFTHYPGGSDAKLLNFVKRNKNKKLFIFKHFFDVHDPYLLSPYDVAGVNNDFVQLLRSKSKEKHIPIGKPKDYYKNWRTLFGGQRNNTYELFPLYVQGVSKFDQGRFKNFIESLEEMGELKHSLFVFFGDHGEGRCDSNNLKFIAHGGELFDDAMRVPLFLYHRDLEAGTNNALVSLVDIFPTIVSLAFDKKPSMFPHYLLDGVALSKKSKGHEYTYAEMWRSNIEHPQEYPTNENWILCQRAIRTKRHKWILRGQLDFFFSLPREISESEFQENINRYILCKFEKPQQNNTMIPKNVALDRLQIELARISNSLIRFCDLKNDPFEVKALPIFSKNNILNKIFLSYFLHHVFLIDNADSTTGFEADHSCLLLNLMYKAKNTSWKYVIAERFYEKYLA